jgi:hypothetical protein
MAENKTKKTRASVEKFVSAIKDEQQKADSQELIELMKSATKLEPKVWGTNIIGFGDYHYKYESGREGDFFQVGFAPRQGSLVLYFMSGLPQYKVQLKKLGKYKIGKGCLYIKKLEDVDRRELKSLLRKSVDDLLSKKRTQEV